MFKHLVYVAGKPVTPPSSALKRVRRQRRERDDTRGALESGKEVRQSSIAGDSFALTGTVYYHCRQFCPRPNYSIQEEQF